MTVLPPRAATLRLFYRVASTFEARTTRVREGGLLLLCCCLLLLLGLLSGRRILPPALSACGHCSRCGTCARVPADDLTYHRTTDRTARAGAGGRAGGCRWWLGCRLLGRRLRGIKTALLDCPRIAGGFIALLLFRRLALGRINILLRGGM